jgi:hypothetical protein
MELAELLGVLQYEVQKSYDFAADLARKDLAESSSVLQVAMERVEIDLPILLREKKRRFNRADREIQPLPNFAKWYKLPYLPEKISVYGRGKVPKGELEGTTVEVELVGPEEGADDKFKAEKLSRLKVIMKPVMK